MDQLIPITGYAKNYTELCGKVAYPGEYYNVLDESPFATYHKLEGTEIGETTETTDVICWFKNKAELESNVRINIEGEVYITGEYAPYTRWKTGYDEHNIAQFIEDGTEEKKILKRYKNKEMLYRSHPVPEEGIYYAVGKEAPFTVYGVVSLWEPVGSYISYTVEDIKQLINKPTKSNPGEVAFMKGLYYLYNGKRWEMIDIPEPLINVYAHVYVDNHGNKFKLREGMKAGTVEYYTPRA